MMSTTPETAITTTTATSTTTPPSSDKSKVLKKQIHHEARDVIYNVIEFFEAEKKNRAYALPVEQSTKRAAIATGYSERTIMRIKKQGREAAAAGHKIINKKRKKRSKVIDLSGFRMVNLRNIVANIYTRKEMPSLKKILTAAKEEIGLMCSIEYLRGVLINELGYEFKKFKKNKSVLIESSYIKVWRVNFLHRMRENEAMGIMGKSVVYLGSTWIDCDCIPPKSKRTVPPKEELISPVAPGPIKKKKTPKKRWVLLDAGGKMGFLNNARYMYEAPDRREDDEKVVTPEVYSKWVQENVLPNLPPNALVVLDPSTASTQMRLPNDKPPMTNQCVELLNAHGYEVAPIPPHNCDLNPVERVWVLVKQRLAQQNEPQLETEIQGSIISAIEAITMDDWMREIHNISMLEQQYCVKEHLIDQQVERFLQAAAASEAEATQQAPKRPPNTNPNPNPPNLHHMQNFRELSN